MNKRYLQYKTETPFDFSKRSSIGCGGFSPMAIYPQSVEETLKILRLLREENRRYYVVGNMSNVLPPDGESETVMLVMKDLKGVAPTPNGVYVSAGTTSGELLAACKRLKLSGAEFLDGVPCTLGGAAYMNAGAGGTYIHTIIESVRVLRAGEIRTVSKEDCGYAYKTSVFMQNDDVIVGANLILQSATEEEIERKRAEYRQKRAHLPKGKSMGCVFKNPESAIAGKLIEGAGLKGLRIGGAFVSEEHANFIINDGNATAEQIRTLINVIKNAVFAQYKIRLREEIRIFT